MAELRFRQIHLDFHTSEKIPGVGSRFNAQQFQEMLQRGHVDSVTVFSKCHHGLSYHDTAVGVRHPHLTTDLLPQQIEACRAIDVKTPIYISAGLDEAMIQRHPEWGVKGKEGHTFSPLQPGFKALCFNTPYLDYLCAQIEEVIDKFAGGDGIFLDIIAARRCYCKWCLEGMLTGGCDPTDDAAVDEYADTVLQKYYQRTTAACRKNNPDLRVFHNSGHIPKGAPDLIRWNSHLELESLPTGGWGYDHFPISAKYAATTGYDFLGMTGKFHTTWGEFGGFKRADALRYECAAMLAFGSKCSIGDQLHPNGAMNEDTYNLVGAAYSEVQAKEPWCREVKPVSEVAVVSPEALDRCRGGHGRFYDAEEGASRMLLETQVQFDVVDLDRDLSPYRLVILPDQMTLSGDFERKIEEYFKNGGKLLLSGTSGMKKSCDAFALDLGLEIKGRSEWNPDYIIPGAKLPTAPVRGPLVIHGGAWDVRPTGGDNETLATRAAPYFNRTFEHFCSHQHTPDATLEEFPAVIGNEAFVYFAHDIFTRYRRYGQPLYRDLVRDAIAYLLGDLTVETNLPAAGRASLMLQPQESRYILHLLYATPSLRGGINGEMARAVEIIEDLVPLHNVECSLRVPETVKSLRLVPAGEALQWSQDAPGAIRFTVPQLLCHQMIELKF
ncbi:MAG: beta-galactosidase trimerization domain-containing protein [Abitibacteriaceae bacterium]|nr:beta-galactosidase trimerization domain-containing protein [Abditibacteriaceae bacterium]